jgi:hypothetical protein
MKKNADGSLGHSGAATPKGPRARRPASNEAWHPKGVQTRAQADRTTAEQMRLDSTKKPRGWGAARVKGG